MTTCSIFCSIGDDMYYSVFVLQLVTCVLFCITVDDMYNMAAARGRRSAWCY